MEPIGGQGTEVLQLNKQALANTMKKLILLSLGLLTLAGCATQRLSDAEKSTIIEQYIAAENLENRGTVSAFNMDSWTSLSDQYLILRTSPFKPFLIKLVTRCHDLDFSPTLLVNSRMSSSLSEGFDSVYTRENQSFKCYISRIYPLSKEQNKALISAVNPSDENKPIEKPEKDEETNTIKTLTPTGT